MDNASNLTSAYYIQFIKHKKVNLLKGSELCFLALDSRLVIASNY